MEKTARKKKKSDREERTEDRPTQNELANNANAEKPSKEEPVGEKPVTEKQGKKKKEDRGERKVDHESARKTEKPPEEVPHTEEAAMEKEAPTKGKDHKEDRKEDKKVEPIREEGKSSKKKKKADNRDGPEEDTPGKAAANPAPEGESGAAQESTAGAEGKFAVGSKVKYWSQTHSMWIETRVMRMNPDGTIDVKGKLGAKPELIKHIHAVEAEAGATAEMCGQWLPKGARCHVCSSSAALSADGDVMMIVWEVVEKAFVGGA